jgi:hypothetical protein
MKSGVMLLVLFVLLVFAGCKDKNTLASQWAGTYYQTSVIFPPTGTPLSKLVIQATGDNTVRLICDSTSSVGVNYTFTVIQNATVISPAPVLAGLPCITFSETDPVYGHAQLLAMSGKIANFGSTITLEAGGINNTDTISFWFNGAKQ